jgi:threonine dehydrogenase-like Zn-dependent dehydrogenase
MINPGTLASPKRISPNKKQPATTSATMAAAVLLRPRLFDIRRVPLPIPAPNQVRIRVEGCGIRSADLTPWEGKPWLTYPYKAGEPGREAWGIIDSVGYQMKYYQTGERVAFFSQQSFAEYELVEPVDMVRLPEALNGKPFPAATLASAVNVFRRCEINRGDTVSIVGMGALGVLLAQLAALTGARVIAIGRRPCSLKVASESGAWQTIQFTQNWDVVDKVRDLNSGNLCNVVIEATGAQPGLDLASELAAEYGRLIIAGCHQEGPRHVNMQLWNWRGLDVVNAHERRSQVLHEGLQEAVGAVEFNLIDPSPLYTHQFPLDEINEAFSTASSRPHDFMKALISF